MVNMEKNKVYCMDCKQGIKELDKVHLVVTSPPYNIAKDYGTYKDNLDYWSYLDWLNEVWELVYKKLVNGGYVCINVGNIFVSKKQNVHAKETKIREILPTYAHTITNCMKIGFSFQEHFIWNKIGNSEDGKIVLGSYPYPVSVYSKAGLEHILVFKKGDYRDTKNKRTPENKILWKDWNEYTKSVWTFSGERMDKHCAPFPLELPRRLIRMYSFTNDIVLDPFMGSGTTAVASKELNRKFIGFEIDKKFCDMANKRASQRVVLWDWI